MGKGLLPLSAAPLLLSAAPLLLLAAPLLLDQWQACPRAVHGRATACKQVQQCIIFCAVVTCRAAVAAAAGILCLSCQSNSAAAVAVVLLLHRV
jgi:hypothetical protein